MKRTQKDYQMKFPYQELDILQLTDCTTSVKLGNELILLDNLNEENETDDKRFRNFPIKLSFSVGIVCLSGHISFRINLNEYTLRDNDMLLCQNGDFGEFLSKSNDCRIIVIAFNDEYFQNTQYSGSSVSLQRLFRENPFCRLSEEYVKEFVSIFCLMKSKISETDNAYRKGALMGYVQVLLYNAYYWFEAEVKAGKTRNGKSSRRDEIFDRFIRIVQKDYREHRSIIHYADVLCISPKYLSQVVKQSSGRLAGDWINDYVILEAKAMLKSRKYTIQQVSDFLNFTSQSFFGRYFKEKVGCSPSAYQKLQ